MIKKKMIYGILTCIVIAFALSGCGWDEDYSEDSDYSSEAPVSYAEESTAQDSIVQEEENVSEDIVIQGSGAQVSFETVDINGDPMDLNIFSDAKVILLNLWEPWCGPCVGEMPDLNKLYLNYKDKGLLVVGAYTTYDMDAEAKEIVEELEISYPIIKCNEDIYKLEQDYVPATYLLDKDGKLITEEPFVGAQSYDGWEDIIEQYIN